MSMDDVIVLHPAETVSLDPSAFQALVLAAGPAAGLAEADDLFEELILCLSSLEAAWYSGEFERLKVQCAKLISLSDQLGMEQCGHVARLLAGVLGSKDTVATAALVARVVRLGEMSLTSVLEFAYRRI